MFDYMEDLPFPHPLVFIFGDPDAPIDEHMEASQHQHDEDCEDGEECEHQEDDNWR